MTNLISRIVVVAVVVLLLLLLVFTYLRYIINSTSTSTWYSWERLRMGWVSLTGDDDDRDFGQFLCHACKEEFHTQVPCATSEPDPINGIIINPSLRFLCNSRFSSPPRNNLTHSLPLLQKSAKRGMKEVNHSIIPPVPVHNQSVRMGVVSEVKWSGSGLSSAWTGYETVFHYHGNSFKLITLHFLCDIRRRMRYVVYHHFSSIRF